MDLLNPLLVGGAALAAVPIILHLLMRQKPRVMAFPALRFIRQRKLMNQRRLRLRHWLLLAMRALLICLLALALARPSLTSSGMGAEQELPVAAAMIFDTGPQMGYVQQNHSRLEEAQQTALWLLEQLPRESRVAVLDSTITAAVFQVDMAAAKQRIERLQPGSVSRPLVELMESAAELLARSELARREMFIYTDVNAGAWQQTASPRLIELVDEAGIGIYVIDVGVENPRNLNLGELQLSRQLLSQNSPLEIQTSLAAVGMEASRQIELLVQGPDGETLSKRSEAIVEVPQDGTQVVTFRLANLNPGITQGVVRLVGGDGLAADDQRYFTVRVVRPWNVLIVAPDPADRRALFVSQALAPEKFRQTGEARFHVETISYSALSQRSLAGLSAVCLLDPPPMGAAEWRKLATYVSEGGGVAMFLGSGASDMAAFNAPQAQQLLPGTLSEQGRWPDGEVHLDPGNYQHPLLAVFRPLEPPVAWAAFPVFRAWKLEDLQPRTRVVVAYSNGVPAIVEQLLGRGRVLTMTTPVTYESGGQPWNLLPVFDAWPFVVLTNEMLLYLVGSSGEQFNYFVGQTAEVPTEGERIANYLLVDPSGRRTRQTADADKLAISINTTELPGNYQVESGGQDGFRSGFSVNLAPEATELRRISPEQLSAALGELPHQVARQREQIDRAISMGRVGRELYPWLIFIVAVLLGGEHVLANRFYRESRGPEGK